MITIDRAIGSVSDLLEIIAGESGAGSFLNRGRKEPEELYWSRFSYAIWFRGQRKWKRTLVPGAFRKTQQKCVNEVHAAMHAALCIPDKLRAAGAFERLAFIQHYGGSTRLLDWSSNALVGLFFAAGGNRPDIDEEEDGALFVLNAMMLNTRVLRRPLIAHPDMPSVILRAEMSRSATLSEWSYLIRRAVGSEVVFGGQGDEPQVAHEQRNNLDGSVLDPTPLSNYAKPIAVWPYHSTSRIIKQDGRFTLHGGSMICSPSESNKTLPSPVDLSDELVWRGRVGRRAVGVFKFRVQGDRKRRILKELSMLGIRRDSLFPEVEYQVKSAGTLYAAQTELRPTRAHHLLFS